MKKHLTLILCCLSLFASSCEAKKVIKMNGLQFTLPSDWNVDGEPDSGDELEIMNISSEYGTVLFLGYPVRMDNEATMQILSDLIEYSQAKALRGATLGRSESTSLKGLPSTQSNISNLVDGKRIVGAVVTVSTVKQTFIIFTLRDEGYPPGKESAIIESIQFTEPVIKKITVGQRLQAQVSSLNSQLPQPVDEFTRYDKAEIVEDNLIHSYSFIVDVDLDQSNAAEIKRGTISQFKELNNALLIEWLNSGNRLSYRYHSNRGDKLIEFTITEEDVE